MPRRDKDFFRAIPRVDLLWITGGVALLFAPLWAVMMSDIVAPGRTPGFIIWCVLAGLTGACWFLGGSYRRIYFIPAVLLNVFVAFGGWYFETRASTTGGWFGPGTRTPTPTLEGGIMLAMFIGAFVMIVSFLGRVATPHMRMRAELRVASDIHAALVRPIDRTLAGLRVVARSRASSTMGGDLVDLIERPDGFDLVLADVTGHGVKAGVVMALAKGVFHAHLRAHADLAQAAAAINRDLCRLTETAMFVTAAIVRVRADPAGSVPDSAECLLAGHPPAILLASSGPARRIEPSGLPLGIDPNAEYESAAVTLLVGDRLCIYSDGLTEAVDHDGREVGIHGLEQQLLRSRSLPPDHQLDQVLDTAPDGPGREPDDRSLALLAVAAGSPP